MVRLAWLLSLSASALAIAAAQAQPADEEVVVTSPLRGSAIESLQGIDILNRQAIIERLNGNLGDLLLGRPGVSSTAFGAGAGRPIIRGLGDDRIRILENGIGTIDASTASPDHAVGADPLDARRIEVLRGAAALAYGGNAVGGVVNVIDESIPTFAPEGRWVVRALAGYTSVDEGWQGSAGVTGAFGGVVANLDVSARSGDDYSIPGYAESAALRAEEDEEAAEAGEPPPEHAFGHAPNSFVDVRSYSGGLSLVRDWGFVGVGAKRYETEYGLPGHEHEHEENEEGEEEHHEEEMPFIELRQNRYQVQGEIDVDWGAFTETHFGGQISDYTHTEFEAPGVPGTIFNVDGYEGRIDVHNGHDDDRLTGASGIQFSHTDFEAIGDEAFMTPTETTDIGIFTVQRWDAQSWGVEGGLRLEDRQLDNEVAGGRDFTTFSGALGVFFRPSGGWFAGVTVARTERAPTGTELFSDGPHLATGNFEVGNPNLDIETATSIEGSLRFESNAWRLEANAYAIGFDGYIALVPTGNEIEIGHEEEAGGEEEAEHQETLPEFAFVQRDATFSGGEISLWVRLATFDDWTVSADAAADIVNADFDDGAGYLPRIPPRTFTLGLNAESETVGVRIELVDIAEQDDTAEFETPTEGSTVLNARLTWQPLEDQDVTFILDGTNLSDEEVRIHASYLKDDLPRPGASVRFALAAGL